ncbi:protealysin inhibitor emfourin [Halomonas sp. KM-1]|uniref:protealysin inhibitor emfourin n=1 Tax=Halomonas sp. KM-1 TaxID=590061 RepID=UPI0002886194|nr:protealysin inhibitor emfourin [Halomonas sp. KM-1]
MSQPPPLTPASVVWLRREGGVAHFPGLARPRCIRCARYSEAQRDELWRLLSSAEAGRAAGREEAQGADRRRFCLSVEDADGASLWSLTLAEEALPGGLLEWWRRADDEAKNEGDP